MAICLTTAMLCEPSALEQLGVAALGVMLDPVRIATEGALWGSIKAHGFLKQTAIVCDGASQFDVDRHALCWVHAERPIHKLDTTTASSHGPAACARLGLVVLFYRDLKAYQQEPTPQRKAALHGCFDRIFKRRTGFATLDRLLARLHANKTELLKELNRPEIPLHTNGSENDIRCQVTKRKIIGGTQSDTCRDAFLGLARTCAKLGTSFWDYLGARRAVARSGTIARRPELVGNKA